MNNKEEQIKVYVILGTIIMLLVIFSGITYAFFSASNNKGSTSIISATSGKMTINYADGTSDLLVSKDIQPSNTILVNKTFTLTGTNTTSGLAMPYKVGLKYTSTFSDGQIHYYIKEMNRPDSSKVTVKYTGTINQTVQGNSSYTGYTHGTLKNGNKYTEMVTGVFLANTSNQTITFNLILQFPDNNENQDSEKGKTFNGKIVINQKPTLSDYIAELDLTKNGLEEDKTTDKNLRYVGASPNNYLKFNNETWRIVGVFNNITSIDENGEEKKESLVKIVRNDSLGIYSWDTSKSSINSGYGINEWSQADLMYELNCDGKSTKYCRDDITEGYLSNLTSGTTTWYNSSNNAKNGTYDYSKNIKSSLLDKVAKVRWNTSGAGYGAGALNSYNQERRTTLIDTPSDNVPRNNTWDGKIALIYPSDYGYASTDRACRNKMNSKTNDVSNCKNENWLFNSANQWTLAPGSYYADRVCSVYSGGDVADYNFASNTYGVRPALFLKSDVVILSGEGTNDNPFILE